jgi:hypothetical protein
MVRDGRFPLTDAISDFTDLSGINAAFERMKQGVGSRTVVVVDAALAGPLPEPASPRLAG